MTLEHKFEGNSAPKKLSETAQMALDLMSRIEGYETTVLTCREKLSNALNAETGTPLDRLVDRSVEMLESHESLMRGDNALRNFMNERGRELEAPVSSAIVLIKRLEGTILFVREKLAETLEAEAVVSLEHLAERAVERIKADAKHIEEEHVARWTRIQAVLPEPAADDSRSLVERVIARLADLAYADEQLTHLAKFVGLHGMTWAHVVSETVSLIERQKKANDAIRGTMARPIDPDLDDLPRISGWSRGLLERAFREAVRSCGEEKTENRRLRKLLGDEPPKSDSAVWLGEGEPPTTATALTVDATPPTRCLGQRWVPVAGGAPTDFIDEHIVIQTLDVGSLKHVLLVLVEVHQPHQSEETFFKPVKRTESEAFEIR